MPWKKQLNDYNRDFCKPNFKHLSLAYIFYQLGIMRKLVSFLCYDDMFANLHMYCLNIKIKSYIIYRQSYSIDISIKGEFYLVKF